MLTMIAKKLTGVGGRALSMTPFLAGKSILRPAFALFFVGCLLECPSWGDDKAPQPPEREPLPGLVPAPRPLPGIGRWQLAFTIPRGRIQAVSWSPDGRKLAYSDMT